MPGGNGGNEGQLNIEIDEETSRGIYTNFAVVSHTNTEFVIDFSFVFPQQSKTKVRARIISSPTHTKRFFIALQENIKKFEEKFGQINI